MIGAKNSKKDLKYLERSIRYSYPCSFCTDEVTCNVRGRRRRPLAAQLAAQLSSQVYLAVNYPYLLMVVVDWGCRFSPSSPFSRVF